MGKGPAALVVQAVQEKHHKNVMDARLSVVPDNEGSDSLKKQLIHLRLSQKMVKDLERERLRQRHSNELRQHIPKVGKLLKGRVSIDAGLLAIIPVK